jgi:hypothetical protein
MKAFLLPLCLSSLLFAASETYHPDRLEQFYDEFLTEERTILEERGVTSRHNYTPPPNPTAPPFKTGMLPVVLVNNSSLPDSSVYVLVTGENFSSGNQFFGEINLNPGPNYGVMTQHIVSNTDNGSTYTVALSQLPRSSGGRVFYINEQVRSGIIWFSMNNPLSMGVTGGSIVQPDPLQPVAGNSNYTTNFDIFEITWDQSNQVYADATAVSFFSIPLYAFLANATSLSSNTGLYQPRSFILSQAAATINANALTAASKTQWNNLFLRNGSTILRYISTGKGMSVNFFDFKYLDNAAAYGFSYIDFLWTGVSAYYKSGTRDLVMSVTTTTPPGDAGTYTYTGNVQGDGTFLFTSNDPVHAPNVTFLAPNNTSSTLSTSFAIFSAKNLTVAANATQPTAGSAADAVSKLFEEALIAGLLPLPNGQVLSLSYLTQNRGSFYTINNNLSSTGKATGPWYDIYSKSLHALGSIYTYGFDEPLWPEVLLQAPYTATTYLGITIGNIQ